MSVMPKAENERSASPHKGKGREEQQDEVSMADWIPDPALWDKMGLDKSGTNLAAPVKTIEVSQELLANLHKRGS